VVSSPPTPATEPRRFIDIPAKLPETREDLVEYIMSHPRYSVGNCYGPRTWSRNIKIWHMELTKEEKDKVFDFVCDSDDLGQSQASEDAWFVFKCAMDDWAMEHKEYKWYTNGRSGGYVIMCNDDKTTGGCALRRPDEDEIKDDNVWDLESIKSLAQDLFDFDWAVNNAIWSYVDFCMTHSIVEDTIHVAKKVHMAVEKEEPSV
jgi:hypothetical protein